MQTDSARKEVTAETGKAEQHPSWPPCINSVWITRDKASVECQGTLTFCCWVCAPVSSCNACNVFPAQLQG